MRSKKIVHRMKKELEKESSPVSVYELYDGLLEQEEMTAEEAAFIFGFLDAA